MAIADLLISEYIEGSSNNKAIELFNGTGSAINLSGYTLEYYFNGNSTVGLTVNLTGTVGNNDVFVIAQSSANATILAQADLTNGAGWFNGDDAIVLKKNGTIIDSIGQVGFDPGTEWGSGLISTADNTLRRKSNITTGDTNPNDVFAPSLEWEGFATDTFNGLGTHTVDNNPAAGITITPSSGNTSVNEEGETTDTYTLALNNNPTGTVQITVNVSDGETLISSDSVNFSSSLVLSFTNTNPTTITVKAVNDNDLESSPHSGTIVHSITGSGDPNYSDILTPISNVPVAITDNDVSITKIHTIQGNGLASSLDGNTVTIEGVVVGDFQGSNSLRGFFVQEEDTDTDGDITTSEGIFVFDGATPGVDVAVGDVVKVTGIVDEFFNLTEITNVSSVTKLSTTTLPTAATVNLPFSNADYLEKYEGMLVNLPQELTVTEFFQLGRFGQIVMSSGGRLQQPTNVTTPGAAANILQAENDLNRLIIDDGKLNQNPDPIIHGRDGNALTAENTLRGGDTATGITGVLTYSWGGNAASPDAYRIHPTETINFVAGNPRPETPEDVGGSVKVASFNVLNYFNGNGLGDGFPTSRGADSLTEFNRQRNKIINAIATLDADVVGLMEIENDGYGAESAIADLVNGLNNLLGADTYAYINPGVSQLGGDEIAVGLIYKPTVVTPIGQTVTIGDGQFQSAFDNFNRKPLAQTFQENATGEIFTTAVNHFKSKGSLTGLAEDEDLGDGQGNNNYTRTKAAEDLTTWLATNPTGIIDSDYLIIGDLNAYAMEDPITTIKNAGYTNLIQQFIGIDAYSYTFDGQIGYLDHALATSSLTSQVTDVTEWHINADEPNVLDYNTNFKSAGQINSLYSTEPFRSSDHDPILLGLNLSSTLNEINGDNLNNNLIGTVANDIIQGLNGNDILDGKLGNDRLDGANGNDTLIGSKGNDFLDGGNGNDILIGVELNGIDPGKREIDTLTGGNGENTFVLGDGSVFYNDLGNEDYASIVNFRNSDRLQLFGNAMDYSLGFSPTGLPTGTAIFQDGDLIAIVQTNISLSLNNSQQFSFV